MSAVCLSFYLSLPLSSLLSSLHPSIYHTCISHLPVCVLHQNQIAVSLLRQLVESYMKKVNNKCTSSL